MSRVGKQIIDIPEGVKVKFEGQLVTVNGPKGELKQALDPKVSLEMLDNSLQVKIKDETDRQQKALWGLYASLIKNMIIGVSEGFSKQLEISGVGYTAAVSGKTLTLKVGYSHPVEYAIPEGIDIKVEGNVITISGIDKQLVGEVAAQIKKVRKPEPYKGKGIKYVGEQIIRKAGKAAGGKGDK